MLRRYVWLQPTRTDHVGERWTASGWSSDRYQQEPGQVDRLWLLDVGGQRLAVDAWYLPAATAQDRAELENVADSIRFLESP